MEIKINYAGEEYPLATTLRVAYAIQGKFNHKPYAQIFQELDTLGIDGQLKLLYTAFNLANPNVATEAEFINYHLDHGNLSEINVLIAKLLEGITFNGLSPEEVARRKNEIMAMQTQV